MEPPNPGLPASYPVLLNTMFPWGRPYIDVELRGSVGEIDAGAIFEVYSYSQAAVATARSETGTVTTKHGLVIRTLDLDEATGDTVVAAGLGSVSPGGWDAAFEQLSRSTSAPVLESGGKMLGYPLDRVAGESAPLTMQLRPTLLLILAIVPALGVGSVAGFIRRTRRRKLRAG